jgi:hypothetical protein
MSQSRHHLCQLTILTLTGCSALWWYVVIIDVSVEYNRSNVGAAGMITRDPSNPLSLQLLDSGFADSEYWPNNFNDMLSAMNVSAVLLLFSCRF